MKAIIISVGLMFVILIIAIIAKNTGYDILSRIFSGIFLIPWFGSIIVIMNQAKQL